MYTYICTYILFIHTQHKIQSANFCVAKKKKKKHEKKNKV